MSKEQMSRRDVLRTSGGALAALSGVSLAGNTAACVGCDPGDGGGGGGGGNGSPPSVSTQPGYANGCDGVVVNGYLGSLGTDDSANVWFDYGPQGDGLPHYTNIKYMDSTGSFCDGDSCWYDSFGCLDPGTYEYRAVATNSWGRSEGYVRTFTV